MSSELNTLGFPPYQMFHDAMIPLDIPYSVSELHGMLCGYICAGAIHEGETFLQALFTQQGADVTKEALLSAFQLFATSQQRITQFDFNFSLMLPEEHEPFQERAQAFTEWCIGFTDCMAVHGISLDHLVEDEAQEAYQHLIAFSELDYESQKGTEEDEVALTEVNEYARLAVLNIFNDLVQNHQEKIETTAH